ncbi:MAG: hypothetical protein H6Q90_1049 [Deltaproteobacteria bacterium]|nr:hypothetical protein [Deltaproteobacteria bacterium]
MRWRDARMPRPRNGEVIDGCGDERSLDAAISLAFGRRRPATVCCAGCLAGHAGTPREHDLFSPCGRRVGLVGGCLPWSGAPDRLGGHRTRVARRPSPRFARRCSEADGRCGGRGGWRIRGPSARCRSPSAGGSGLAHPAITRARRRKPRARAPTATAHRIHPQKGDRLEVRDPVEVPRGVQARSAREGLRSLAHGKAEPQPTSRRGGGSARRDAASGRIRHSRACREVARIISRRPARSRSPRA